MITQMTRGRKKLDIVSKLEILLTGLQGCSTEDETWAINYFSHKSLYDFSSGIPAPSRAAIIAGQWEISDERKHAVIRNFHAAYRQKKLRKFRNGESEQTFLVSLKDDGLIKSFKKSKRVNKHELLALLLANAKEARLLFNKEQKRIRDHNKKLRKGKDHVASLGKTAVKEVFTLLEECLKELSEIKSAYPSELILNEHQQSTASNFYNERLSMYKNRCRTAQLMRAIPTSQADREGPHSLAKT